MRKIMGTLGAAAALAAAVIATGGSPASASTNAEPCGYYQTPTYTYYNHCGKTTIQIKVDLKWAKDKTICVRPGTTGLGSPSQVRFASYVGGAGCNPS